MKKTWLIFLAIVLVAITGCVNDQNDNAALLSVKVGSKVTIKLDSNPTTGYEWQIKEIDPNMLELLSSNYVAPQTNLVGAGGEQVLTFQALKQGQAKLVIVCLRSWEKDVAPINQAVYKIVINK